MAAERRLALLAIGIGTAWVVVAAYAIEPALPDNPIRFPGANRVQAQYWLPEGWGFFTRDPREDRLLLYARQADGAWLMLTSPRRSSKGNLFGLRRTAARWGLELGLLLREVALLEWTECSREALECLQPLHPSAEITNRAARPSLCGTLAFRSQEVLPWAWAATAAELPMPSKFVVVTVRC